MNGAVPAAASASTGNGGVDRSITMRPGSSSPWVGSDSVRTACAKITLPASRIAAARSSSTPGSGCARSKAMSNAITLAPARRRWRTSSACSPRGHSRPSSGMPSSRCDRSSIATTSTCAGGATGPRHDAIQASPTERSKRSTGGIDSSAHPTRPISSPSTVRAGRSSRIVCPAWTESRDPTHPSGAVETQDSRGTPRRRAPPAGSHRKRHVNIHP